MKKVISLIIVVTMLLSLNIGVSAENISADKATTLQLKRQAFLDEYSSLNIIEMSDLDPDDPDFWFIMEDNRPYVMGYGNNTPDPYFVPNSEKNGAIENIMSRTTSNTTYKVYNSNGTLKYSTVYSNLFEAINKATSYGNYVKEVDTGETVFVRDNNSSTYFRFQYTNYYDDAWAVALTPQQWVNGYRYAHVIDGNGDLIANSYYLIGGITPATEALEPESGSYYYKFSNYWSCESCEGTIDFSDATYRINLANNNVYIYTAAQSTTQTIELGIMSCQESNGGWWSYYRDSTSNWKMKLYKNKILEPVDVPDYASQKPTFVYDMANNATLTLKLSLTNTAGKLEGYIGDTKYTLYGNSFSKDLGCTFLQAVSLPEALPEDGSTTMDLRCDSFLRNIKLKNCKVYTDINWDGTPYRFYPDNSDIMNTAFIYCDDTITYSRSNDIETINIDYTLGYMN